MFDAKFWGGGGGGGGLVIKGRHPTRRMSEECVLDDVDCYGHLYFCMIVLYDLCISK